LVPPGKFHVLSNYFHPLSVSGKLTGTLSGFITRVKPASFDLLCAWREVQILCQHMNLNIKQKSKATRDNLMNLLDLAKSNRADN
jgi:hypothetical protein